MSTRPPRRSLIGSYRYSVVIKPNETDFSSTLSGVLDLYDGKHVVETHKFSSFENLAITIINYWEKKLGSEVNVHRFSNWLSEYFSDIGITNINFYQLIEAVRSLGKGVSLASSGVAVREAKVRDDSFDPLREVSEKSEPEPVPVVVTEISDEHLIETARPEVPPEDTVLKPSELFKTDETVSPEVKVLPPIKKEEKEEKPEPPTNTLLKPSEVLREREIAIDLDSPSVEDHPKIHGDPVVTRPTENIFHEEDPPVDTLLKPSEYLKRRETIDIFGDVSVLPSQIPAEKKTRVSQSTTKVKQQKLMPPSEHLLKPSDILKEQLVGEEKDELRKPSEVVAEQDAEAVKQVMKIDPEVQKIPAPPITSDKVSDEKIIKTKPRETAKETLDFEIEVLPDSKEEMDDSLVIEPKTIADLKITDIMGVGDKTAMLLKDGGYDSIEQVIKSTPEDLSKIRGIGPTSAKKLIYGAKALVQKEVEDKK